MKIKNKLRKVFLETSDGKETLNLKPVVLFASSVVLLPSLILHLMENKHENAKIQYTDKELVKQSRFTPNHSEEIPEKSKNKGPEVYGRSKAMVKKIKKSSFATKTRPQKLNFNAKQVIRRSSKSNASIGLPTGSNFIGKLITPIDTRNKNRSIKVLLPYGGSYKGVKILDRGTILLGRPQYAGEGSRVNINFHTAISSTGNEIKFEGQALSPEDYSVGIIGDYNGTTGIRVATTLGLAMVSGMTDVLTEKESISELASPSPKATIRNALYQGTSKIADMESARQASLASQKKNYVTVEAGTDLIVSLTHSISRDIR